MKTPIPLPTWTLSAETLCATTSLLEAHVECTPDLLEKLYRLRDTVCHTGEVDPFGQLSVPDEQPTWRDRGGQPVATTDGQLVVSGSAFWWTAVDCRSAARLQTQPVAFTALEPPLRDPTRVRPGRVVWRGASGAYGASIRALLAELVQLGYPALATEALALFLGTAVAEAELATAGRLVPDQLSFAPAGVSVQQLYLDLLDRINLLTPYRVLLTETHPYGERVLAFARPGRAGEH